MADFYSLALGNLYIAAAHGRGVEHLLIHALSR